MRSFLLAVLVLACAGCGGAKQTSSREPAPAGDAVVADAPQLIVQLIDQKVVYECPKCGMTFDRAGECSMKCGPLVETRVDYICPADNKPVERAGTCERCPLDARVEKTVVAQAELPPVVTGN